MTRHMTAEPNYRVLDAEPGVADDGPVARARQILASARGQGQGALDESTGKSLLEAFGIDVPASAVAATPEEARDRAARLTPPFVVKVLSTQPLHKSDLGGVRLNLDGPEAVHDAATGIADSWPSDAPPIEGFLVEEMAPAGQEVVIGGFLDPQFGPMVMVGLGGVFVEVFADVTFRVCPITQGDAAAMLGELKAQPLLNGARGRRPVDMSALIDALLAIGGKGGLLMELGEEIAELDINPLIVGPERAVAVDARFVLTGECVAGGLESPPLPDSFAPLFAPKTIAVAGVSGSGQGSGNRFIRNLRSLDFEGDIYPIHPSATELEGLPVYRSLAETPKPIDYAYIAVPKAGVADMLRTADGRVCFAQIMTSGFGESGARGVSQDDLLAAARAGGVRILGPNSLGTYSPRGRMTFTETQRAHAQAGRVGVISQSGGIGVDFVRTGQARGLRYSAVVTIGNSADLGPNDLLEHFLADPDTAVIGMYLEDIGDGRRFVSLLRAARGRKPVVLLKGGRSAQGQKAVMSHTGALAGDMRVWLAVAAQTGCILVETIEELLDVLLMFQSITPSDTRVSRRLALFGNGGGASVVATDCLVGHGFDLAEPSEQTRARLDALELPDGASAGNPIDFPANAFNRSNGRVAEGVLQALSGDVATDVILLHLNMPVLMSYRESQIVPNIVDAAIAQRAATEGDAPHLVMVFRSDGSEEVDTLRREQRQRAVAAGIPVFESFAMAATALAALARFEAFQAQRRADRSLPS